MTAVTTHQIDSTNPKKAVEQKSTNQAAHTLVDAISADAATDIGAALVTAGLATAALQSALNALFPTTIGRKTGAGSLSVIDAAATTATLANVASSATTVTLMASNTARIGFVIYNDSTAILYVKFGATASATSFTYFVNPGDTLDIPITRYTGVIDGIWSSANGNARVTEI